MIRLAIGFAVGWQAAGPRGFGVALWVVRRFGDVLGLAQRALPVAPPTTDEWLETWDEIDRLPEVPQ